MTLRILLALLILGLLAACCYTPTPSADQSGGPDDPDEDEPLPTSDTA